MRAEDHRRNLPADLRFLVVITSDTIISRKTKGDPFQDVSGEAVESLILGAGYLMAGRVYLPNDLESIRNEIKSAVSNRAADVIVISGGTGIGPKDLTIEAVVPLMERILPGFGELFRHLSYESIGTPSIASRATAGIFGSTLIFALPGSPAAVKLAMEKIILPESPHLLKMIRG